MADASMEFCREIVVLRLYALYLRNCVDLVTLVFSITERVREPNVFLAAKS